MASCKFQHFRQIRSLLSDQGLTFGVSYHRNSHEKRAIGYARFPRTAADFRTIQDGPQSTLSGHSATTEAQHRLSGPISCAIPLNC